MATRHVDYARFPPKKAWEKGCKRKGEERREYPTVRRSAGRGASVISGQDVGGKSWAELEANLESPLEIDKLFPDSRLIAACFPTPPRLGHLSRHFTRTPYHRRLPSSVLN